MQTPSSRTRQSSIKSFYNQDLKLVISVLTAIQLQERARPTFYQRIKTFFSFKQIKLDLEHHLKLVEARKSYDRPTSKPQGPRPPPVSWNKNINQVIYNLLDHLDSDDLNIDEVDIERLREKLNLFIVRKRIKRQDDSACLLQDDIDISNLSSIESFLDRKLAGNGSDLSLERLL